MAFQNTAFQATAFLLAGVSATPAYVQVESNYAFSRTLYVQAKIAPPPRPADVVAPTTMDWQQPLSKAVTRKALYYQSSVSVTAIPAVDSARSVSIGGPSVLFNRPLYYQSKVAPPPQPPAAADNNITGIAWHRPLADTAPPTRPTRSQAVYAFPPPPPQFSLFDVTSTYLSVKVLHYQDKFEVLAALEVAADVSTYQWQQRWQGPPKYKPPKIVAQPFVPKEAVLENTITGIPWLIRFQKAVPTPPVNRTQPVIGPQPYEAPPNLTTTLEWLQAWKGPPRYKPPHIAARPFVPKEAVLENTITGIAWLQRWQGPPRYRPIKVQALPFVPKAVVVDVHTPDKWLRPLAGAPKRPAAWRTPPPFIPFTAVPQPFSVFSVETVQVSTRALFYESTFVPYYPYVAIPEDAGPADEHERIACVPLASRVAIVPELSRVVDVPLSDREQDSNEYRDRSCGTPPVPAAIEPEVPTEESPFQEDAFQHEDDAFQ